MTTHKARETPATTVAPASEEETVARYLQQHADFFERHQQLLLKLRLPHARSGSTISLIERQIEVLREKQSTLEQKLSEFMQIARSNDAVAEKMHRLTRRLLRARTREAAIEQVEASLREDFDAFHSVMVLVDAKDVPTYERFLRVVPSNDPSIKSFESLFASGKPRCGQVRDSQRQFLFGAEADDIGSVALVPLGDKGALGLLALGSTSRDRFHPGMSTDFLGRLAEVISDALR